jgi:hypothetical protein
MDADAYLEGTVVIVPATTYAVARVAAPPPDVDAFATVHDDAEPTVVIPESRLDALDEIAAVERGWRRLSFDATLPFDLVGFLARVTTALAEADVAVFAISAYATDHVLVKEADLATATERLSELGCVVERAAEPER